MALNKKFVKNLSVILGLLALSGFLAYSLIEYQRSGIAQDGIVTCANGQCFWNAHIHMYVPIRMCGENYVFPKFKGSLANHHAHGDENIIHWHDKIAFDAEKKRFLEPTPFALNTIFKDLGLPIAEDSLLDKKDGDRCGGSTGAWKVFVNGTPYRDWRTYEWRDRDIVLFVFDGRTAEEIEKELRQNSMQFPSLGEG